MKTIEEYLRINAEAIPYKTAFIFGDQSITYKHLYDASKSRAEVMCRDYCHGSLFPIIAKPSIEYFIEYFAIHLAGGIAIPLHKGITPEELKCYESFDCQSVPQNTADILFTTGTTGHSKGVVLSHDAILADAENLAIAHEYSSDIAFIICGPLNHCGSWSKVFPCIVKGTTIILLDGLRNIDDFFVSIEKAPCKIGTFLVPATIKMVMEFGGDRLASLSDKIDFIETGGAPMSHSDMKQLRSYLPNSRLYNTYASTEAGIISTYDFNVDDFKYGCVGHAMKNSKFFVEESGQIKCSGRTVMSQYLNDTSLTESILSEGVISTSDLGFVDSDGMLHISGRNNDTINTGGYKVEPTEIENVVLELPQIKDCICIAAPHVLLGTCLKLLYVIDENEEAITKQVIAKFIKTKLERHKIPLLYEQVDGIKTTYNGKKDRKYYYNYEK